MNFRKLALTLHLVAGLISAIVLVLLGLSGSAIAFEREIEHWLNPALSFVPPQDQRLPLDTLAHQLEQAHPGTRIQAVMLPVEDNIACNVTLRPQTQGRFLMLAVNPYTGEELGSLEKMNTVMRTVHQFHTKLLMGDNGKLITGAGALFLFFLSLSGLILWWPRRMWKMSWSGSGRRRNFDLHNVLGFHASIFMFLFAVTGAVIHWDEEAKALINHLTGAPPEAAMPHASAPVTGAKPLSAGEVHAIALKTVPGAKVTSIQGLNTLGNAIRVIMKYPEDHTPMGRTNLYLDPTTGTILFAQTSRDAPLGTRMVKLWNREIHTGDLFGAASRVIACLASLALPLLAITGPLIWWGRIRRKSRPSDEPDQGAA